MLVASKTIFHAWAIVLSLHFFIVQIELFDYVTIQMLCYGCNYASKATLLHHWIGQLQLTYHALDQSLECGTTFLKKGKILDAVPYALNLKSSLVKSNPMAVLINAIQSTLPFWRKIKFNSVTLNCREKKEEEKNNTNKRSCKCNILT